VLHAAADHRAAKSGFFETSSPMTISFRSGYVPSLASSPLSAEKASMMRATFLCGLMRPRKAGRASPPGSVRG